MLQDHGNLGCRVCFSISFYQLPLIETLKLQIIIMTFQNSVMPRRLKYPIHQILSLDKNPHFFA